MFIVALLIGGFAYMILLLGLLRALTFWPLLIASSLFIFLCVWIFFKKRKYIDFTFTKWNTFEKIVGFSLVGFYIIGLIGALTPEIYFDALWYHLTLPKMYLAEHGVRFFPGNLFYYSAMPQLVEMLYIPALFFDNEISAKLIHYLFALLTSFVIIKIGSRFFSRKIGLIAALIFISDLSVAWLSSTAYIDLGRAFFESVSIYCLLVWWQEKKEINLIKSGIALGFAISCKYFALGTLGLSVLFVLLLSKEKKIKHVAQILLPALTTSGFWFVYAYIHTGNPIYPIFTSNLDGSHQIVIGGLVDMVTQLYRLSNQPHDWLSPISPIYLMLFPLIAYAGRKKQLVGYLSLFALGTLVIWYLIPRTGGSRFIVPYIPLLAILAAASIEQVRKNNLMYRLIVGFVAMVIIFNGLVRVYVNKKTIPFLLGQQTKQQYLVQNLDFSNAFYDVDNVLPSLIHKSERILVVGGHNLFYLPVNFIHESYYQNEPVAYIMTQYVALPQKYVSTTTFVYENKKTAMKLYKVK